MINYEFYDDNIISVDVDELEFDVNSELIKKKNTNQETVKVSNSINIKNIYNKSVFIKTITNKQNLYIASPSKKILHSNENVEINIIFFVKFKDLKKEILDEHKFKIYAFIIENNENLNESNISGMIKTTNKTPNQIIKLKSSFKYNENYMKKEEIKHKKSKSEISEISESKKIMVKNLKIKMRELQTRYNDLKFENSEIETKINDLTKNQILSIKLELNKDKLEYIENIPGILVIFLCFISFILGYFLTC